ncbi:hypothetical protein XU18_1401 [Perkinsela sp. CCAP 1560/4]|nr:hypothetical protein XU18_1401 [Perkinsela sp. CCAP 1560/4]|eukprot:KNH08071.1 hypothetical protein XU18_1401 [Perkinsela sp. CCAP 1560/4]
MIRKFPTLSAYTVPFLTPQALPSKSYGEILKKLNSITEKVVFAQFSCGKDLDETILGISAKQQLEAGQSMISCGLGREECIQSKIIHSAVTAPMLLNSKSSPEYTENFPSDFEGKTSILAIRAIAPSPADMKIRPKDRVDIFPSQSLDSSKEEEMIIESFKRTAQTINELVKAGEQKKIFIVKKTLTRIDNLNRLFECSMEKFIHNHDNVEIQVIPSSTAYNRLTMFPEKYPGVYVLNDIPNSLIFEQLLTGLAGGNGTNYTSYAGQLSKGRNFTLLGTHRSPDDPFAIFLAAAKVMSSLGLHKCAKELLEKLKLILRTERVYPLSKNSKDSLVNFLNAI